MVLLKIGNVNFTDCIVSDTYAVDSVPVIETWEDIQGNSYARKIKDKIIGTFDLFFTDMTAYNEFYSTLRANMKSNDLCPAIVCDNKKNQNVSVDLLFDFKPIRKKHSIIGDCYSQFTVTVEEL